MTDDTGHRAFSLKQVADQLLKRREADPDGSLPFARCVDGSDIPFESFRVDRGVFQFMHSFHDTRRCTLTCVPADMIVFMRASVPMTTEKADG